MLSATLVGGGTASFTYDNNGNLTSGAGKSITYNAMNKPTHITAGSTTVSFWYDANWQRYKKAIGSSKTLYYIDGSVEVEYTGGDIITRTYIDDIAIIKRTEHAGVAMASHEITYTLRDRLGSVVTLSNHNNLILEHRSYDPFGKPRYGTMQASPSATLWNVAGGTPFTMRGFTDHEHIDEAQLIHMNGRVYDYNLGRFLSVDPFIQEPGNSQSLNPYSYIMNNPLAGTDPSGYIADCILAIHCAEQGLQNPFKYPPNCPFCVSVGGGQSEDNGKEQSRAVAKEVGADSIGAPGELGHNGLRKTPLVDHSSLTPSEVAGDFWDNPNFQSALSQAEREISAEVINESDRKGLLFNPEHANREHGSVIAESDDGTFSYTRPSVDVPSGTINHPSSLRTGFVGGQTAIKNATLVVIGVGPNTRGTTILGNAVNYIELAKELNTPIIVVATWRDRGNLYIFNAKGEYSEVDAKERNKK